MGIAKFDLLPMLSQTSLENGWSKGISRNNSCM